MNSISIVSRTLGFVARQKPVGSSFVRAFTGAATAPATPAASGGKAVVNKEGMANTFNKSRSEYEKKIHEIRKQLTANIKKQEELADISSAEVKRQIIIKKAISKRSKKEDSLVRQQKLLAVRERFKELGRERLAKHTVLSQTRDAMQQLRYARYIQDLEKEKSIWLDKDSISAKLNSDFFSKPSSTGYKTPSSKYWRYHVKSLSLKRFMDEDLDNFGSGNTLLEKVASNNNNTSLDRRVALFETLDKIVASGKDREELEKLMDDYIQEEGNKTTSSTSLNDLGLSTDDFSPEELEMLKENIKQEFGITIENLDSDISEITRASIQAQESSAASDDLDKEDLDEMIRALNTHDPNEAVVASSDLDGPAEGDAAAAPAKAKVSKAKVSKAAVKKAPAKGKPAAKPAGAKK